MFKWSVSLLFFLTCSSALAGYFEVGLSASYRQTNVNEFNYSTTQTLTGDISYYFWEYSAVELSYTNGRSLTVSQPSYQATADFQLAGADFVFTLAEKEATFRPYVKIGVAYQKKKIVYVQSGTDPVVYATEGPSPSVGFGFRLGVTQTFAIKAGLDAWTSPLTKSSDEKVTYDTAARVGVSWLF